MSAAFVLRAMADEHRRSAAASRQKATMADFNARGPNLPDRMRGELARHAEGARNIAMQLEGRAAALEEAVAALEARP